ncbi:MAG TPA: chemotaxis protein CheW [Anaeromyxobacteraceae bacterium]|nr:chemotaxis protein CheW [Anaeromyxobacteraceae bacterium]
MSEAKSEILMFQVGPRVFAAEVYDVIRIGSVHDVPPEDVVGATALGVPFARRRGIVVGDHAAGTERALAVDQVIGIRSVPETDVHPLPAFAAACLQSAAVTGFVLVDDSPTLLIDLPTLVREGPAAPADAERT